MGSVSRGESLSTYAVMESVFLFVCLTRPVQESVSSVSRWEVSLTPRAEICLIVRLVGSLSYISHAVVFLVIRRVGSFSSKLLAGFCLFVR